MTLYLVRVLWTAFYVDIKTVDLAELPPLLLPESLVRNEIVFKIVDGLLILQCTIFVIPLT